MRDEAGTNRETAYKFRTMKDPTIEEAISSIERCNYRCEAGPLENNVTWRWMKERLRDAEPPPSFPEIESRWLDG